MDIRVDYRVVIEDEDWGGTRSVWRPETFTMAGGDEKRFTFPSEEMDVRIVRFADGLLLFQAFYTPGDFDRDHGTIEISVNP